VPLEGLGQLKNPMTSSGIEPATFRLSASTNYVRYRVLSTGITFRRLIAIAAAAATAVTTGAVIFLCGLFYGGLSTTDCISLMVCEYRIGKDLEGSGRGLIGVYCPFVFLEGLGKTKKT
jgi:hypothetical protein